MSGGAFFTVLRGIDGLNVETGSGVQNELLREPDMEGRGRVEVSGVMKKARYRNSFSLSDSVMVDIS